MPASMKGRKKGPNFYFTGTIEDMRQDGRINKALGRAIVRVLGEVSKSGIGKAP